MTDITFWEFTRLFVQGVVIVLLWRAGSVLKKLLQEGQRDRLAREEIIADLKDTAIALADRTRKILDQSEARTVNAEKQLADALQNPQNGETLKQIETNTRDAADSLKDK